MNLTQIRQELEKGRSIFELELRVVYYARVSTEKDNQLNSLQNQTAYYEKFIRDNKNWIYSGAYIDEGVSGTSVKRRDSFMRMINDAALGMFDLIVTKEISRFSRNTLDSISYTRRLLSYGVGVYFQNDSINTLTPDAELRLTIMSSLAQDEVRRISERVRFGFRQAQEQGVVLGNDNTFGYSKSGGKLEINEAEAEVVREVFRRYVAGNEGLRRIANSLENAGIASRSGKAFTYSTLCGMIKNPKYKGFYAGHKYTTDDYRTKKVIKLNSDDWLVTRDPAIPAIVDEKLWDEANRLLSERGKNIKEKGGSFSSRYRYSGKLICADHGAAYHRHTITNKNGTRECWSCRIYRLKGKSACDSPTVYSNELDAMFEELFRGIALDRSRIIDELTACYGNAAEPESKERDFTAELERIAKKKEKLLELAIDGMLSNAEFAKRNEELNKRASELEEKKRLIETKRASSGDRLKHLEALRTRLGDALSDGSIERGELTELMLDHITVKKTGENEVKLRVMLKSGISDLVSAIPERGSIASDRCILSYETGISQAQVSRLEKGALERIRKQLV